MKMPHVDDETIVADAPVSALRCERKRYGSVEGLEDEELATPEEFERLLELAEWGPVLRLPVRQRSAIRPSYDEDGRLDWGAFGTVDFERYGPRYDREQREIEELREQRRDALIAVSIIRRRLPRAGFQVLKLLERGVIEMEHIESFDMYHLARFYLRAKRLADEIQRLEEKRWERRRRHYEQTFGELGAVGPR
jgi:hypothetical protein